MILLVISIIFLVGSVAATTTASNDTIHIEKDTSLNEVSNSTSTQVTSSSNTSVSNTVTSIKSSTSSSNSTNSKSLKASTTKYSTKVSVTSITEYAGETIKLKSVITTSSGTYVKDGKVAFKINGKTIGTSTVSNGGAALNYKIPTSWSDEKYTIIVVYGENDKYQSSTGTGYLYLKNCTDTNIAIKTTTATIGSSTRILAVLTTDSGAYVKDGKVAFKINGKTIGTATVSNGGAAINYTIPSSWSDGTYNLVVVYGESGVYKASTASTKLTVTSPTPSWYSSYLKATSNCQVKSSTIQNIAKKFSSYTSVYSKAVAIFNYLNSKTSYSYYSNTRYGAVGTWTRGYGNCVDMSHLLIAVARASGIPARYCHATCTFRSGLKVGHVWCELYVNGKWYKCDLTSSSNTFGNIVNWKSSTTVKRYISLPF